MAKFCDKQLDLDAKVIEFTFSDGTVITADIGSLSAEIQLQLMMHGASQKLGDSYASAKGNVSEGVASLQKTIETLQSGSWTAGRADGETKPRTTELAEALARIKGIDIAAAQAAVEAADEEKRKTLRSHPKVKAVIAAIRAEKAARKAEKAEDGDFEV